jgi:effector-binding domain-containing protein
VNRLLALKDLGFSLENIRILLDGGLSKQPVRAMLSQQAAEIRRRMQDDQGKLARLEAWLTQIAKEDELSEYEVVVKRVPSIQVAAVRGVVPTPPDQDRLWKRAMNGLANKTAMTSAPWITLYYDEEAKEQDWDIEVCIPLDRRVQTGGGVIFKELPTVESMATVLHRGPFLTISNAYAALTDWITENGYRIVGPAREATIHATHGADGRADQADPSTIVEVQLPAEKV